MPLPQFSHSATALHKIRFCMLKTRFVKIRYASFESFLKRKVLLGDLKLVRCFKKKTTTDGFMRVSNRI